LVSSNSSYKRVVCTKLDIYGFTETPLWCNG